MDRGNVRNMSVLILHQAVSKPVWHIPLLCVQWKTPDDGQRNCQNHVEFYSKNKFEKLMHLVGFTVRRWSVNGPSDFAVDGKSPWCWPVNGDGNKKRVLIDTAVCPRAHRYGGKTSANIKSKALHASFVETRGSRRLYVLTAHVDTKRDGRWEWGL